MGLREVDGSKGDENEDGQVVTQTRSRAQGCQGLVRAGRELSQDKVYKWVSYICTLQL